MSFYILVVLYNKYIDEIVSLSNFMIIKKKYDFVNLMVVDNSEGDYLQKNSNHNNSLDFIYLSNGKNIGLSRAYNIGITKIKSLSDDYYIMLSDDDTLFSIEYIENVINSINDHKSHLYCGVVKTDSSIFSPKRKLSFFNRKMISNCGIYSNIMAINSGIVFDKYIVDHVGFFDESFFVDMIDYWFCYKLKKQKLNNFIVLDGTINQRFSGDITVVDERVRNRFKIYRNDCKMIIKQFPELFLSVQLVLFKRRIKLLYCSIKSKN